VRVAVCVAARERGKNRTEHVRVRYGADTISRLLKIIRLFCRISSLLKGSLAKESYDCKEATNGRHGIESARVRRERLSAPYN